MTWSTWTELAKVRTDLPLLLGLVCVEAQQKPLIHPVPAEQTMFDSFLDDLDVLMSLVSNMQQCVEKT